MRSLTLFLFWIVAFCAYQFTKLVVWLDRKFQWKHSFPTNVLQLQQEEQWLLQLLKKKKVIPREAEIVSCNIKQLNPELIFRSDTALINIKYRHNGSSHLLQCIAKFSPVLGSVANRAVYNIQQNCIKEINFYQFLAPRLKEGAKAPSVYFLGMNAVTAHMCIIMEYLDNYEMYDEQVACPIHLLPKVVISFATMHASFWGTKNQEVQGVMTIPYVVSDFLASSVRGKWNSHIKKVYRKNCSYVHRPQTVIHGDARVGNLMFPKENKVVAFIDWQATRLSIATYDLAYFLMLSVRVGVRKEMIAEMKQLYYDTLIENGVSNYSEDAFTADFKHASLMVLFMLSIPWLSGEGSFTDESNSMAYFCMGHFIWYGRLKDYFASFDYKWMSEQYELSIQDCEAVISKLLTNYQSQFQGLLTQSSKSQQLFNEAHESLLESV